MVGFAFPPKHQSAHAMVLQNFATHAPAQSHKFVLHKVLQQLGIPGGLGHVELGLQYFRLVKQGMACRQGSGRRDGAAASAHQDGLWFPRHAAKLPDLPARTSDSVGRHAGKAQEGGAELLQVRIMTAFDSPDMLQNCLTYLREYVEEQGALAACAVIPQNGVAFPQARHPTPLNLTHPGVASSNCPRMTNDRLGSSQEILLWIRRE